MVLWRICGRKPASAFARSSWNSHKVVAMLKTGILGVKASGRTLATALYERRFDAELVAISEGFEERGA